MSFSFLLNRWLLSQLTNKHDFMWRIIHEEDSDTRHRLCKVQDSY